MHNNVCCMCVNVCVVVLINVSQSSSTAVWQLARQALICAIFSFISLVYYQRVTHPWRAYPNAAYTALSYTAEAATTTTSSSKSSDATSTTTSKEQWVDDTVQLFCIRNTRTCTFDLLSFCRLSPMWCFYHLFTIKTWCNLIITITVFIIVFIVFIVSKLVFINIMVFVGVFCHFSNSLCEYSHGTLLFNLYHRFSTWPFAILSI